MRIYKESEWSALLKNGEKSESRKPKVRIGSICVVNGKPTIVDYEFRWGGLSEFGGLSAQEIGNRIDGIGKYCWQIEDDWSLSVVKDGEAKDMPKISNPDYKMTKPIVIPFKKWFEDYSAKMHKMYEVYNDVYGWKTNFLGYSMKRGIITNIDVVAETDYHWTANHSIEFNEILIFTYGICIDDVRYYNWRDGNAYFDKDLNLVFDGGKIDHINKGYYVKKNGITLWEPKLDFLEKSA